MMRMHRVQVDRKDRCIEEVGIHRASFPKLSKKGSLMLREGAKDFGDPVPVRAKSTRNPFG